MLKSYAVALVLATSTPVAIKSEESVQAPAKIQAAVTITTDTSKNGVKTGSNWQIITIELDPLTGYRKGFGYC